MYAVNAFVRFCQIFVRFIFSYAFLYENLYPLGYSHGVAGWAVRCGSNIRFCPQSTFLSENMCTRMIFTLVTKLDFKTKTYTLKHHKNDKVEEIFCTKMHKRKNRAKLAKPCKNVNFLHLI